MAETFEPPQTEVRRSWWGRNWKWVVPVGVILPLVLCGTCVGVIVFAFGAIRNHEVTQEAFSRAKADPEVIALLGEPLEMGRFVSGTLEAGGSGGEADLSIPISGPKGAATIKAVATKNGTWNYSKLIVVPGDGGAEIDLRAKAPSLQRSGG